MYIRCLVASVILFRLILKRKKDSRIKGENPNPNQSKSTKTLVGRNFVLTGIYGINSHKSSN